MPNLKKLYRIVRLAEKFRRADGQRRINYLLRNWENYLLRICPTVGGSLVDGEEEAPGPGSHGEEEPHLTTFLCISWHWKLRRDSQWRHRSVLVSNPSTQLYGTLLDLGWFVNLSKHWWTFWTLSYRSLRWIYLFFVENIVKNIKIFLTPKVFWKYVLECFNLNFFFNIFLVPFSNIKYT